MVEILVLRVCVIFPGLGLVVMGGMRIVRKAVMGNSASVHVRIAMGTDERAHLVVIANCVINVLFGNLLTGII